MSSTETEVTDQTDSVAHMPPDRAAAFTHAVADHRLSTGGSRADRPLMIAGGLLMVFGVIGAFVQFNVSLSMDDQRDILSQMVLAIALLGVSLVGATLFTVGSLARLLRLWLLRQIVEARLPKAP